MPGSILPRPLHGPTVLIWLAVLVALALSGRTATAQPVPLDPNAPERRQIGDLRYRGGLVLAADRRGFGGLSAIDVSDDGARLLAVSDNGDWFTLALSYGADGDLATAAGVTSGRLTNPAGRPLGGKGDSDAEGLARRADGDLVVSFERDHRLLAYPRGEPPFGRPPTALARPPGLEQAPRNSGAEALTALGDGRLLVFAEDLSIGHIGAAWIGDGRTWLRLNYRLTPPFEPTGAALLPDGDVLVLERSFSLLGGIVIRLVRVAPGDLVPGLLVVGREVARLQPPLTVDNFEGVAARRGPAGETLVYLVSDNNFSALQRTLLLMFELTR